MNISWCIVKTVVGVSMIELLNCYQKCKSKDLAIRRRRINTLWERISKTTVVCDSVRDIIIYCEDKNQTFVKET